MEYMRTFTRAELSNRDGKNMEEVWVAYKGFIFDVTTSKLFKGGKHYRHVAGQDLTEEMKDAPHLDDVLNNFPIIGKLI